MVNKNWMNLVIKDGLFCFLVGLTVGRTLGNVVRLLNLSVEGGLNCLPEDGVGVVRVSSYSKINETKVSQYTTKSLRRLGYRHSHE